MRKLRLQVVRESSRPPFRFLVSRFLFICEFCLSSFDELFPFLNAIFPLCGVAPNLAKIKRKKPTKKQQQQKNRGLKSIQTETILFTDLEKEPMVTRRGRPGERDS